MNISLPPDLEQFVQRQVDSAVYASVQDVICAALELFKKQQADTAEGEFNGAIPPEEIERRKKLKLYPYDETADREDEEAFEECLTQGGISNDRVITWLDSIDTNNELPCPVK
jgi:Arc/MetJ-type ribon-helix-helix transcriptional regulator